MIVRIWEAQVAPRRVDEFCTRLCDEVLPALRDTDGFEGAELLRSVTELDHRVLLLTRWRDEAAVRAYAGPMWRIRPVWAEGEFGYLEHPPTVSHFRPTLLQRDRSAPVGSP
ncbi:heme-degrading monooxygenase HmoA [Kitasatospora gansuensis]|uniref:Heme-degrading monooxygenase HmoA n=1 Tax=Kitasatospora gansuensis TaxID=258050 RepID=A0A7W7S9C9_9ACTN|nr:antibiotic biosynthesis monooxygenase [Kitasatospora gansuensis]MBB4945877.1 heme-degrading monooxygenase HmoA [Kitasatospora gansuensis]